MNKGIIIAIVILVLAGGEILIVNTRSKVPEEVNVTQENEDAAMSSSRYAEYSKTVLDQSADNRRVLFFYASWCPTCRPTDENLKQNINKIPEDVTIIRVNYNDPETDQEEKELAKKYEITYQHTFVQIDAQGNEITKWNGGQISELLKNLK